MQRFVRIVCCALLLLQCVEVSAQKVSRKQLVTLVEQLQDRVAELEKQVEGRVVVAKPVNPAWEKWQDVRYNYGFNTEEQPIFNTVEGVLESTTMLSVRGGKGRWNNSTDKPYTTFVDGGHLFEGWNGSETCRLTMLIGKQAPDIACIQVYSPKGLYKPKRHFGWVKIGSDDAKEGVDFGRRWALSFVPFTLGSFDKAPTTTLYQNSQLESTAVPVGTLYYDTKAGKIGCYTAEGWRYIKFE
ncbi:MAG: hypothetical protein J6K57_01215 [Alistipes sp.]|nr:hypothetical protein [Alistipes sp.]